MSRKIQYSHKRNLLFITIILTSIFVFLNVSISQFTKIMTDHKIDEETNELLLLTTYLIEDNDLQVAIEYIDHYSDSHSVEIEIFSSNRELLFSSSDDTFEAVEKTIYTRKGSFFIQIDNSHSVTLDFFKDEMITYNLILLTIYLVTLISLLYMNHLTSDRIKADIYEVSSLIKSRPNYEYEFNYSQFDDIHKAIWEYIDEIDLLRDKREMNVKGLAHDVKTPLTIISSYVENSEGESRDNAIDSVMEINTLVNDLMEDKYIDTFRDIDITEILNETIHKFESIFETKDVGIEFNQKPMKVHWSKRDFRRVLENIFANAFYYSSEHTDFKIKIKGNEISFTSTGSPMTLETIDNIFKKGYRGNNSFTKNSQGKGLGLYICRLLLTPIGATLTASSSKNNNTFYIRFEDN